jgi:DNA replication protein DnaC
MRLRNREVQCQDIRAKIAALRMHFVKQEFESMLLETGAISDESLRVFDRLLTCEVLGKKDRKVAKSAELAKLPYLNAHRYELYIDGLRTINKEDFELLFRRYWLDERYNVFIKGDSRVGKSYLASALCVDALGYEKTVLYMEFDDFLQQLNLESLSAAQASTLLPAIAQYDVIVIDNWLYHDVTEFTAGMIINWLEKTVGQTSLVLTSALSATEWKKALGTKRAKQKILSSVINRANHIELLPLTKSVFINQEGKA